MAESLSEKELIAALEAKGTYVISRKTDDKMALPLSAPPTHAPMPSPVTSNPLLAPPIPGTATGVDKAASKPLSVEDYLRTNFALRGARPKEPMTSTPTIGDHRPFMSHDLTQYHLAPPSLPKVPFFSGDDQKGDVPYIEWRFEIRCLVNDVSVTPAMIAQTIRKSLRGTARSILISLGENASADAILTKLDSLFGDVSTNGMLMQEFFNSFQKPDESVTSFGCRLERILQLAVDHGHLAREAKNDLLRHKFWTSLASDKLKSQTRHKYDSISNYDDLLREIRTVEKEIAISPSSTSVSKKAVHQPVQVDDQLKEVERRMDRKLESLEKRIDSKLEDKFNLILQKLDHKPADQGSHYSNSPYRSEPQNRQFNTNRGRGYGNSNRYNQQPGYGRGRGRHQSSGSGQSTKTTQTNPLNG